MHHARQSLGRLSLLLILAVACGDSGESEYEMPAVGSVEAWNSCLDENGSVTPELCKSPLVCVDYGFCAPPCTKVDHCAAYGFGDKCNYQSSDEPVCIIACLPNGDCPDTGGNVKLRCDPLLNQCA